VSLPGKLSQLSPRYAGPSKNALARSPKISPTADIHNNVKAKNSINNLNLRLSGVASQSNCFQKSQPTNHRIPPLCLGCLVESYLVAHAGIISRHNSPTGENGKEKEKEKEGKR